MKTIQQLSQCLSRATLVAALTGFMLLPISTLAQEKGGERLMKLNRPPAPPKQRADAPKTVPMSCPKCQDVTMRIPDLSAKGGAVLVAGGRPFKSVVRHQCEGCLTTLATTGHGKAKQQMARHTCTACGADSKSCCDTTGKLAATSGM